MSITIETMKQQHLQATIDVASRAFGEEWRKDAEIDFSASISDYPRPFTTLVAVEEGKVVGASQCIHANLSPNTYIIMWLCVDPDHERQGIGTEIMKNSCTYIEDNFLKGKKGTIVLVSAVDTAYYEKLGFNATNIIHTGDPLMMKIVEGV